MRGLAVALVACVVGALAYGVTVLVELRAATVPPSPTAFVQATWSVYRFGPGHKLHVEQLSLDCKACHRSDEEGKFDAPGPAPCVGCHEAQADIQHSLITLDERGGRAQARPRAHEQPSDAPAPPAGSPVGDCMDCHGFGPDSEKRADDCLSCHARARGHASAILTHADVECSSCHEVHENRVAPMQCTECHAIKASHGHAGASPEQSCLDCHKAHDRASAAVESCRACHGPSGSPTSTATEHVRVAVPTTATFDGHSCTGCHQPHEFSPKAAADCQSCHGQKHALAGKGHKECSACHAPHAARESVAGNVCASCHDDVALKHGTHADKRAACTTCHVAHPAPVKGRPSQAGPVACASCHQDVAGPAQRAHGGGLVCTTCHQPHGFELAGGQTTCVECHARESSLAKQNSGHATCTGCHQNLPHGKDLSPKSCVSCHSEVHAHRGHATCTSCHDAHTGKNTGKSCADCHNEQARLGIHTPKQLRCVQCHEQHAATLVKGVADCSGCHARSKLPGLHDVSEHAAACTSCHAPHDQSLPSERATCLSCHKDQVDHQPEAKRCSGCHQFVSAARGNRRLP